MKKRYMIIIAFMAVLICVQITMAQGDSELKKISLVYSDHSPPGTGGIIFMKEEYLPKVQKELAKVGYELEITFHHSESLYKFDEQVQACKVGLVDMTIFSIDYETARAPLHEILNMPLMGYDEYAATRIWFDLQDTIPEFGAELEDFKELMHFMALPILLNLNKVARVPADFKGLVMQASSMAGEMLQSAGVTTVVQSPNDWYTSLKNNLIDGIAVGITGIPMFNLQDVVKVHIQPTGDSLGLTGTSIIMNRKKFESFPPEVQKVLDDHVLWASDQMTEIEVKNIPESMNICREAGNQFITLTSKEMEEWYGIVEPIHNKWIKKMKAKGLPGEKVYNEAKRLAEKYRSREMESNL
jgi:TRAP-type C4-dicarboxylate transport system substrate-binding protein